MSIPLKDYRKAYYKMNARNKVEITFEGPNTEIAKFLFHNSHEKYLEIFGDTMKPLVENSDLKISFGVIRYGENIVGMFTTDGGGELIGDFNNYNGFSGVSFPRKIEEVLNLYNVRYKAVNG